MCTPPVPGLGVRRPRCTDFGRAGAGSGCLCLPTFGSPAVRRQDERGLGGFMNVEAPQPSLQGLGGSLGAVCDHPRPARPCHHRKRGFPDTRYFLDRALTDLPHQRTFIPAQRKSASIPIGGVLETRFDLFPDKKKAEKTTRRGPTFNSS